MQPKVSLFIQCLVDSMFPDVGEAMVKVLRRLDVPLEYPDGQTCCGQPALNSGYRREAKAAALRFLRIFENAEVIVCPSGSCVHMVRHHYPELFADDNADIKSRIENLAGKCYELSEYLVDILGITDVGAAFPAAVTYHDSCHLLRGLGVKEQPRRLLHNVKGLQLIEMKDSDICCGFGGTFSVNYPDISTAMVDEKIDNIVASRAEYVTGCDISCLMNIKGRLSRREEKARVLHLAEILAADGGLL